MREYYFKRDAKNMPRQKDASVCIKRAKPAHGRQDLYIEPIGVKFPMLGEMEDPKTSPSKGRVNRKGTRFQGAVDLSEGRSGTRRPRSDLPRDTMMRSQTSKWEPVNLQGLRTHSSLLTS